LTIVTIMTDFGLRDGNVGVMKGVILGIAPEIQLVDISHLIGPQNVLEGALTLGRSAPYFPSGTIHIGVVDPGVGTLRRPLALRAGAQFFVGPDNGLFTIPMTRAEKEGLPVEAYHLDQPQYWLPEVSHVFHGRDIFAPVAAHLALGVPLEALGKRVSDPLRLQFPEPQRTAHGWLGEVIHIDHFGNIATDIRSEHLANMGAVNVALCGVEIHGLVRTFGERSPGELIALFGSTGNLIVSVVNGSAAHLLNARIGDAVEVTAISD
jgi:hypothetical protein